jgi:hypothetical protein
MVGDILLTINGQSVARMLARNGGITADGLRDGVLVPLKHGLEASEAAAGNSQGVALTLEVERTPARQGGGHVKQSGSSAPTTASAQPRLPTARHLGRRSTSTSTGMCTCALFGHVRLAMEGGIANTPCACVERMRGKQEDSSSSNSSSNSSRAATLGV